MSTITSILYVIGQFCRSRGQVGALYSEILCCTKLLQSKSIHWPLPIRIGGYSVPLRIPLWLCNRNPFSSSLLVLTIGRLWIEESGTAINHWCFGPYDGLRLPVSSVIKQQIKPQKYSSSVIRVSLQYFFGRSAAMPSLPRLTTMTKHWPRA